MTFHICAESLDAQRRAGSQIEAFSSDDGTSESRSPVSLRHLSPFSNNRDVTPSDDLKPNGYWHRERIGLLTSHRLSCMRLQ
jgi:hypothetical protein